MPGSRLALSEWLLQEQVVRTDARSAKIFALLSLLIGLGLAVLLGLGVQHLAAREPITTMAWQYKQPARVQQFPQPLRPCHFMRPAMGWEFGQMPTAWQLVQSIAAAASDRWSAVADAGTLDVGADAVDEPIDERRAQDLRSSVVKIFNTKQRPNWMVPWQKKQVESTSGSGAVVRVPYNGSELMSVLTAAHVIADARYLQIQRSSDRFGGEKFPARVVAVCHEADLALVLVDDATALVDITPLELAPADVLPRISDKVRVVGYPIGGTSCSITEGVVNRVEVQEFSHSLRRGLALTVDAAINSGNSGGPIVDSVTAKLVGVAIQKMVGGGVELQGHAVPVPLVWRFLTEASSALREIGPGNMFYNMKMPTLACRMQNLEAPSMRRSLGLSEEKSGMFINYVEKSAPSALLKGDVLLAFDGHPLDNQGFTDVLGQRLHFFAVRDLRTVGQKVQLTLWRDRREQTIEHTLVPAQNLVPFGQYDVSPRFFICGGLVFQPLSYEYMQGFDPAPTHLVNLLLQGYKSNKTEEVIVLTMILEDEINNGYGSGFIGAPVIKALNGQRIQDLDHLVQAVREAKFSDGVDFLQFDGEGTQAARIVLATDGLEEADQRITRLYGAPTHSHHFAEGALS